MPDWHTADVKAALEKKGTTLRDFSVKHGYEGSAASKALRKPWPAVERLIAAALGKEPREIWPSRYDDAGNALRERSQRKDAPKHPRPRREYLSETPGRRHRRRRAHCCPARSP